MPVIFVADDDLEMRALLASSLRRAGFTVAVAGSGEHLLEQFFAAVASGAEPDLIISDVRMGGTSGIEALSRIRASAPWVPVIVITAFGDARIHARARGLGACAVLDKPFDLGLLHREIEDLLAIHSDTLPQ